MFLDRDGVLNRAVVRNGKPYPPDAISEFEILPGVHEALDLFKSMGFLTVVVTNQPDVRTGKQSQERVEEFHSLLRGELPIDDIRVCYHIDEDNCDCRKPKPGMLLDAARDLGIDFGKSIMIGDRWRDIKAGLAVGCQNFLIDYCYSENVRLLNCEFRTVGSLLEAAELIHEQNQYTRPRTSDPSRRIRNMQRQ